MFWGGKGADFSDVKGLISSVLGKWVRMELATGLGLLGLIELWIL